MNISIRPEVVGAEGLELEEKGIRRVCTAAGVARFKQPIGSIIVRDLPLENLKLDGESGFDGWDRLKGKDGKVYYVGKYDGESGYVAADNNDNDVVAGTSLEDVYKKLDEKVSKDRSARERAAAKHDPPESIKNRQRPSRRLDTSGRVPLAQRGRRYSERDERTKDRVAEARKNRRGRKSLPELALNFDQTRMYEQFDRAVESKDAQTMHTVGKRILNDAKANGAREGVISFVEDVLNDKE